jgi:hypothetical protein
LLGKFGDKAAPSWGRPLLFWRKQSWSLLFVLSLTSLDRAFAWAIVRNSGQVAVLVDRQLAVCRRQHDLLTADALELLDLDRRCHWPTAPTS